MYILPCYRCWCVFGAWRTALRLRAGAVPSPAVWPPRCSRWKTSLDTCCRSCPPPPFWSCPSTPTPPPCSWPFSDGPPAARTASALGSRRNKKGCLCTHTHEVIIYTAAVVPCWFFFPLFPSQYQLIIYFLHASFSGLISYP